jgi:hypothetical protein
MNKLLEIYKDAFEATFGLFKTEGFKFISSIIALGVIAVMSLFSSAGLSHGSILYFFFILLGETVLLLPIYVKLCRIIDDY